jgi:hypothetical protein
MGNPASSSEWCSRFFCEVYFCSCFGMLVSHLVLMQQLKTDGNQVGAVDGTGRGEHGILISVCSFPFLIRRL